MKKFITLLAALGLIWSANGAVLEPAQALQRAIGSKKSAPALGLNAQSPQLVFTGEAENGVPAYYVFTNPSATLFVSADDVAVPLLGYSETGNFDPQNMPPQMQWWLEQYAREIQWGSSNGVATADPKAASASMPAIAPMLKTTWDQGSPYNKYCPSIGGQQTVTGCVATAMAQIMKYYQWPQAQVPSISYTWNGQKLTSPAVTLEWNNMLDSYSGDYTTAQANAVGRLMQAAGYSVAMSYNISANGGSGAYSTDVRGALVNTFGYDVSAEYLLRDFYGPDEWAQLIYDNLKTTGPVYYSGSSTKGGHAFVCDGYDGNGMFHINWGWSGTSNGYFVLSALNPSSLGTGGGAGGYNYNQAVVLKISRPKSGSVAPTPYIGCNDQIIGLIDSRELIIGTCSDNGGFYNYGCASATFTFGVKLENVSTGNVVYVSSSSINNRTIAEYYGAGGYYNTIPTSLANGTYKVYPVYKVNNGGWQLMKLVYGTPRFLTLNVSSSGLSLDGEFRLTSWETTGNLEPGKPFNGALTVFSSFLTTQTVTLKASLCKGTPESLTTIADLGSASATIGAFGEATLAFTGVMPKVDAGSYYIVFKNGNTVVGYFSAEVIASFGVTDMYFSPQPLEIGRASTVNLIIENTYSTVKSLAFSVYLLHRGDDGYLKIDLNYGSRSVPVAGFSSNTVSLTATVPGNLTPGTYYIGIVEDGSSYVTNMVETEVVKPSESGKLTYESWSCPTGFIPGEAFEGYLTIASTFTTAKSVTLDAYICELEGNTYYIVERLGTSSVNLPAQSRGVMKFSGTLSGINPGQYHVVFAQNEGIVAVYDAEVLAGEFGVNGITATPQPLIIGNSSTVDVVLKNTYAVARSMNFSLHLCSVNADGSFKSHLKYGSREIAVNANSTETVSFSSTVPADLEPGDYSIVVVDDITSEVIASQVVEVIVDPAGELTIESWRCPTGFWLGMPYEGYLTISNTFSEAKSVSLDAYLCKLEGESLRIYAELGSSSVTVPAKSQADMIFNGTLNGVAPGQYYLVFAQNMSVIDYYEVEVLAGEFGVNGINATPQPLIIGNSSTVDVVLKNTYAVARSMNFSLHLCSVNADGSFKSHLKYGSREIAVNANSTETVSFSSTVPADLEPGDYSIVVVDDITSEVIASQVVEVIVDPAGDLTIESWRCPTGFVSGADYEVYLTVMNTYSVEKTTSYGAYLCMLSEDGRYIVQTNLGEASATLAAKSQGEFKFSGTLIRLNPGDYYLVFLQDGEIEAVANVEVSPANGTITLESLTPTPNVFIQGQTSKVEAVIASTFDTPKLIPLSLSLCTIEHGGFYTKHSYGALEQTIEPNSSSTFTFTTVVPSDLPAGEYYLVLRDYESGNILSSDTINIEAAPSEIESISVADASGQCRYFNLKGVEIDADKLTPGVYIRRSDSGTTKVIIK